MRTPEVQSPASEAARSQRRTRALMRAGTAGALPAYAVEPTALVPEPDTSLRDVIEGRRTVPADTLAMLEALGAHLRTTFFRRLARFGDVDSLFTPRRYRTGRAAAGSTGMEPVRTPLGDAATANVARMMTRCSTEITSPFCPPSQITSSL